MDVSVSCEECEEGRQAATEVATSRPICNQPGDIGGKRHWCEQLYLHTDDHMSYCGQQWSSRRGAR
jgi:hypothetical protein